MSYDFHVWAGAGPTTDAQARALLDRMASDDKAEAPAASDDRLQAMHAELLLTYPELEELSDEQSDDSPWSMSPGVYGNVLSLTTRYSRASDVSELVHDLAECHALVCFNPQTGALSDCHNATDGVSWRINSCNDTRSTNPDPDRIEADIRRLSDDNYYALLTTDPSNGEQYLQVGYGERANLSAGSYSLERRHGSSDAHYGTILTDVEIVIDAFQAHAVGDDSWEKRLDLRKIDFS